MGVSVNEAAKLLGVSERRVQALARAGRIKAQRVGQSVWLVDEASLFGTRRRSRALAPRVADGVMASLSGGGSSGLTTSDARRVRDLLQRLRDDDDPGSLLASWVPTHRESVVEYFLDESDVPSLRADERIVLTGISDHRARIAAPAFVEGWLGRADQKDLVAQYWLRAASSNPNVRLHVADARPSNPLPLGRLVADLAAWPGPRERAAVRRLVHEVLLHRA